MEIKINMDRLLDAVIEYFDCVADYVWSSVKYHKKHGHGVYFELNRKLTSEEEHIEFANHAYDRSDTVMFYLCEVLGLDADGIDRLHSAGRAARKWYIKTNWKRLIPQEMLDQFERYVFECA